MKSGTRTVYIPRHHLDKRKGFTNHCIPGADKLHSTLRVDGAYNTVTNDCNREPDSKKLMNLSVSLYQSDRLWSAGCHLRIDDFHCGPPLLEIIHVPLVAVPGFLHKQVNIKSATYQRPALNESLCLSNVLHRPWRVVESVSIFIRQLEPLVEYPFEELRTSSAREQSLKS